MVQQVLQLCEILFFHRNRGKLPELPGLPKSPELKNPFNEQFWQFWQCRRSWQFPPGARVGMTDAKGIGENSVSVTLGLAQTVSYQTPQKYENKVLVSSPHSKLFRRLRSGGCGFSSMPYETSQALMLRFRQLLKIRIRAGELQCLLHRVESCLILPAMILGQGQVVPDIRIGLYLTHASGHLPVLFSLAIFSGFLLR